MNTTTHDLLIVLIIAVVTFGLRSLPFIMFPEGKPVPRIVANLSNVMPCAIMGMLVVYCFKNVSFIAFPFALPEIISSAIVIALFVWKKNTLISIASGTICYMLLIHFVF